MVLVLDVSVQQSGRLWFELRENQKKAVDLIWLLSLRGIFQRKHSDPPVSLHGQLLWREFFYTASVGIPNFNKMEGNLVCTQVDWDTNPEHLAAWREVKIFQMEMNEEKLCCWKGFVDNSVAPLLIKNISCHPGCSVFPWRLGLVSPSLMPSWLSWGRRVGSTTWPDMLSLVFSPGEICGSAGKKDKRCLNELDFIVSND